MKNRRSGVPSQARVLVVGFEPTRAFARRRERSLRLPVSPHQHHWLRTLAIPKAKTLDPTRAAARACTMCGIRCVMVSNERLRDQFNAEYSALSVTYTL